MKAGNDEASAVAALAVASMPGIEADASPSTVLPPGSVTPVPPDLGGGVLTNDGTILSNPGQSGTIETSGLVNDALVSVGAGSTLLITSPITSGFVSPSAAPSTAGHVAGNAFTTQGLLGTGTGPVTWTGTETETGTGANWVSYAGGMAPEVLSENLGSTQASAHFTNPALASLGLPRSAVGLAIGPSPSTNYTEATTDTIAYAFSSAVPSGTSFFLWDPGSGDNSSGSSTFTFSASLDGVPVSTAGWSFSVDYPFGIATSTGYAIDPASGTVTVTNYSGNPLPDAVIVATPNSPVDQVSVTGRTVAFDFWGLSFVQNGPDLQIQSGGTLELGSSVDASQTVLLGPSSTLVLDQPSSFAATISSFGAGDTIDLAREAATSAGAYSFVGFDDASNVLTVEAPDGSTFDLQFALGQSYNSSDFVFSPDGHGGTDIRTSAAPPCFAAGTRVLTEGGEVAVEDLREGMRVVLDGGGTAPVRWIGRRRVNCAASSRPETVRPVRVGADCFGPGLPARDLFLSPDHALFLDGVLVPVHLLIDGVSVVQVAWDHVSYFHVELDQHAVMLAEGLPVESYLDTGNRAQFGNARLVALHPSFRVEAAADGLCAPMVLEGPALDRLRARLGAEGRRLVA